MSELPELNLGIVGHIDHGKTTLLSKLTGKFTDTHSEELKRGITIKLGYADMTIYKDKKGVYNNKKGTPVRYVSFIDAPGHEMLMATMLSGAATMDAAILVVDAHEGIKPQTQEHLMALEAKNIRNVIIVQNKIDLVDRERALENYGMIKEFVKGTVAEDSPVIPVSALQEINIDKILEELAKMKVPDKDRDSGPVFIVARSFDINRPGAEIGGLKGGVLGGILKKGRLKVGDEIEIKPGLSSKKSNQVTYQPLSSRILSLHKGEKEVEEVFPGASISIETSLDPFLTKTDSLTGCLVSGKNVLPDMTYGIKIKSSFFQKLSGTEKHEGIEPVKTKDLLMLSVNTTITVGTVEKIKGNELELNLNIPIVALKGDNVGIARNVSGHWRLIGWGEVLV